MNNSQLGWAGRVAVLLLWTGAASAETVRDGNYLCRDLVRAEPAARQALQQKHTGMFHVFRFLKITEIVPPGTNSPGARLTTIEPSSDAKVIVVVTKPLSLDIVQQLKIGDSVAVRGRVKSIETGKPLTVLVEPAVVQFKDRDTPKLGKELLREVDPNAH